MDKACIWATWNLDSDKIGSEPNFLATSSTKHSLEVTSQSAPMQESCLLSGKSPATEFYARGLQVRRTATDGGGRRRPTATTCQPRVTDADCHRPPLSASVRRRTTLSDAVACRRTLSKVQRWTPSCAEGRWCAAAVGDARRRPVKYAVSHRL